MFSLQEYVTPGRTDAEGRLKLVSAVDIMQDCSQMWMKSEPVFEKYFNQNNMAMLLASRQLDVLRIPVFGEKLTITTSVFECRGFHGFRNTIIYDEERKPCLVSWSTGAFVCRDNNKLTKIPEEVSSNIILDPKADMEYLERRIVVPGGERSAYGPVRVMRNDIDMNRHMNNVHYVRIASEYLPKDFRTDRLRVEYKLPAAEGDLLHPYVIGYGSARIYVQLLNGNGQPHAILEFNEL